MKNLIYLLLTISCFPLKAQPVNCIFKEPIITIHFGTGNVREINTAETSYDRITGYCPRDGYYSYVPYTSDCFRGDWLTLEEDHTPGDVDGNMMLVNASPRSGTFLSTGINGLKSGTTYEFGVWMMNVCRISDKCPFPLLPRITIRLLTSGGEVAMQMNTGELTRYHAPQWTQYKALFTAPAYQGALTLTMLDEAPGGCGNDFALDDITFRECIKVKPVVTAKTKTPVPAKPKPPVPKKIIEPAVPRITEKKEPPPPVKRPAQPPVTGKPATDSPARPKPVAAKPAVPGKAEKKVFPPPVNPPPVLTSRPAADSPVHLPPAVVRQAPPALPPPPPVLTTRANLLIKQVEMDAGEIRVDLYDNGTVDGDTVTVYDNNVLLVAHARLSEKPITFRIAVDAGHPRHELVMVADNLGSIPPNTSLMVVTAGAKRYEIYISSTEQKNAKVIFELKKE